MRKFVRDALKPGPGSWKGAEDHGRAVCNLERCRGEGMGLDPFELFEAGKVDEVTGADDLDTHVGGEFDDV